ncbi:MAG: purine-binding chemotaxis protein CheW [Caldilineaceae bacterium]|nr:purine-binding chemotaxis protein CheW [Caldilineaceae bacterium]
MPSLQLVVFTLDAQFYALELAQVHRVVRAMEVTPLPGAPAVILGIVNVQGELMPVVSLRHRFHLPERAISPSDQWIIANMTTQASTRKVALVVDAVLDLRLVAEASFMDAKQIAPDLDYVQGIVKGADGLILIHNLARCLSLSEVEMLDDALAGMDT